MKINKLLIGIFIILLILAVLATYVLTISTQQPLLIGDVNSDGAIDKADLDLIHQHLLQVRELKEKEKARADMNQDGEITVLDLLRIHKYIGGD